MKVTMILLICMIFSLISNAAVEKVKVRGTIRGLGNGEVILMNASREEVAKTRGVNDDFELVVDVETSDIQPYTLYVPAVGPLGLSMSVPTMFLFIDSPKIKVLADIKEESSMGETYKRLEKKSIKGSAAMDEYENMFKKLPVREELSKAMIAYNSAFEAYNHVEQTEENMKKLKSSGNRVDSLQAVQRNQIFELIPLKNKSKVMAFVAYSYFSYMPANELEGIYNQFDATIRDCYGLQKMLENINLKRGCEIGQVVPDFELVDADGKTVRLSSLRGKYVLLDFWASWCGPCRKEIPNMKKVYAEFKDRGLQVVGVSVDNSDKAWRKALEEEKMEYLQLHDSKNITSKLYNYSGIPFIILISPEGIILDKNLRGDSVREKIAGYVK